MKPLSGRQAPCLAGTRLPDFSITQDKISGEIPIVWAPLFKSPDRQREAHTILLRISSFLPGQSNWFSQTLTRPRSKSFNSCKSVFCFLFLNLTNIKDYSFEHSSQTLPSTKIITKGWNGCGNVQLHEPLRKHHYVDLQNMSTVGLGWTLLEQDRALNETFPGWLLPVHALRQSQITQPALKNTSPRLQITCKSGRVFLRKGQS